MYQCLAVGKQEYPREELGKECKIMMSEKSREENIAENESVLFLKVLLRDQAK